MKHDQDEGMFSRRSSAHQSLALIACAFLLAGSVATASEALFPGERSTWNGFDRYDFEVDGQPVLVVVPREPAPGRPWVWHGEFFGHRPEPDIALLGRGFHIVHMKIPDQFGAPQAVSHWNAFYQDLTGKHGLAPKAALVGVSRGGLYCYNWAAANPEKVACIYGDAPVCDLRSWPLGKGKGTGNANEIPKLLKVYGVSTIDELLAKAVSPIDQLEPLARAKVPLLHVYGDADTGVPWDENTGIVAERYRKLGGDITLIAKPGVGHVHGLNDSTPIIEFIARHSLLQFHATSDPIPLGSRRELFVDRFLIGSMRGVELRLHEPRDEGTVLRFDEPWEGIHCGYCTVIRDGDRFRVYYRGMPANVKDGTAGEVTCVAESDDGVRWTKPKLRLFEAQGTRENNVVLAGDPPFSHNFSPFLDTRPGCPPEQRYKALAGISKSGLVAFVSADGLRWRKLRDAAVIPEKAPFKFSWMFDSQNVAFWSESEKKYVCYFRVWERIRRIARTESSDFVNWSDPVLMSYVTDGRPSPVEELYTNQTDPYFRAPHLYVAVAARFVPGRQVISDEEAKTIKVAKGFEKDVSDAVLMTTRGGSVYDRTFLSSFIRPGIGARHWVSRNNYPALGIVQTGPTEMSLYMNQDNAQPTAHLRRYSMRLDGFASVHAPYAGGELLTRPLTFTGDRLELNFATSAAGSIRVEIQDAAGQPINGFAASDCVEVIGNEIERVIRWKGGTDVSALAGKTVRLRFVMKDADLYALRFAPSPTGK